jgi:uncharacterized protein (TIGR01777 family)
MTVRAQRIAITGASGFIGQPLCALLTSSGHTVLSVGRRHEGAPAPDVVWDIRTGAIDHRALDGVDAVIHLAGENISERWTAEQKRKIRESRIKGTDLIARTAAALRPRPAVLVSMSAVGIYGDRGDETLDESSSFGSGFLAETVRAWEASADPARDAGIRVLHPRAGIVLNRASGALKRMLPFFSLGLGGQVSTGRQWMSWVARTDVVRALQFLVEHDAPHSGPVNVTAPHPVRNEEFTRVLANALHRPALAIAPALAIRVMYGEMGIETVVAGQKVLPRVLTESGFAFTFPELAGALERELSPS